MNYDWLDKAFLRLETRILRGASVDIGDVRQTKAAILQGFKELPSMRMEPEMVGNTHMNGAKVRNQLRIQLLRELEL